MKVTFDIALNELKKLFYSPIAWFVLVIFAFQGALVFTSSYGYVVALQNAKAMLTDVTFQIFAHPLLGSFRGIPNILYIFIPLVTMNSISREKGSGAIKLLYSSPVSNAQIILGKYLALVVFCLLLTLLISIFAIFAVITIDNPDTGMLVSGLLGLFLLGCAYAAIGLFMSSITVYPIVAAISTLCLLAFLHFAGFMWQDIEFVRDVTYWLSLSGRVSTFILGLITSEDVLYFLAVIAFFIGLAIIKMNAARTRHSRSRVTMQYVIASCAMILTGYFSSMPIFKYYWDLTHTQRNTLSEESQKVMAKVEDNIDITTYTNMLEAETEGFALPIGRKADEDRFELYTRFKPRTKLNYIYYYKKLPKGFYTEKRFPGLTEKQMVDSIKKQFDYGFDFIPHKEIEGKVDLSGEDYRFVREITLANGKKTFLRIFSDTEVYPDESQITAAFKRMVDTLPKVGFVTGHGERSTYITNERGYNMFAEDKTYRHSLLNNGFDFEPVQLTNPVPDNISILVIADPRHAFTKTELDNYHHYLNRGGNLIIAGEPARQHITNEIIHPLGVQLTNGMLIQPKKDILPEVIILKPTKALDWQSPWMNYIRQIPLCLIMDGACGLAIKDSSQFENRKLFTSDTSVCWSELETTDLENDSALFNAAAGEMMQENTGAISLTRTINQKKQKILVTGDADWLGNHELRTFRSGTFSGNFAFINSAFYWLSDGKAPINNVRPESIDKAVSVTRDSWKIWLSVFKWGPAFLFLATGIFVWVRRKNR